MNKKSQADLFISAHVNLTNVILYSENLENEIKTISNKGTVVYGGISKGNDKIVTSEVKQLNEKLKNLKPTLEKVQKQWHDIHCNSIAYGKIFDMHNELERDLNDLTLEERLRVLKYIKKVKNDRKKK